MTATLTQETAARLQYSSLPFKDSKIVFVLQAREFLEPSLRVKFVRKSKASIQYVLYLNVILQMLVMSIYILSHNGLSLSEKGDRI